MIWGSVQFGVLGPAVMVMAIGYITTSFYQRELQLIKWKKLFGFWTLKQHTFGFSSLDGQYRKQSLLGSPKLYNQEL